MQISLEKQRILVVSPWKSTPSRSFVSAGPCLRIGTFSVKRARPAGREVEKCVCLSGVCSGPCLGIASRPLG